MGALLLTASEGTLIVDGRYISAATACRHRARLRWPDRRAYVRSLEEAIAET